MNKYTKKILTIIEEDLSEAPSLESIANSLGASRYFLSRQFKADTGESYSQYLKRRRISEAAKEIQLSNRRILDIALDYGYSSQEAFQRTYKDLHKNTPRIAKFHHSMLFKRSALEFTPLDSMEWELKSFGPKNLIATGKKFSYQEFDDICQFWLEFHKKHPKLVGSTYGLSLPLEEGSEVEKFFYLIACEPKNRIEGAVDICIPEQTYAVFRHIGGPEELMRSFNYIWGKWVFENLNFNVEGMDFEYYSENYDPGAIDSVCEIYLPVSKN